MNRFIELKIYKKNEKNDFFQKCRNSRYIKILNENRNFLFFLKFWRFFFIIFWKKKRKNGDFFFPFFVRFFPKLINFELIDELNFNFFHKKNAIFCPKNTITLIFSGWRYGILSQNDKTAKLHFFRKIPYRLFFYRTVPVSETLWGLDKIFGPSKSSNVNFNRIRYGVFLGIFLSTLMYTLSPYRRATFYSFLLFFLPFFSDFFPKNGVFGENCAKFAIFCRFLAIFFSPKDVCRFFWDAWRIIVFFQKNLRTYNVSNRRYT